MAEHRLSGTDTFFLLREPAGVRALLAQRLARAPSFLRRLHEVPFGLDCPIWVDDPATRT